MKDTRFIEAIFSENDLYQYSPIVICVKDKAAETFVSKMLTMHNVKTYFCSEPYEVADDLPIAFLLLQDIEDNLVAQEQLVKVMDSGRLNKQPVFITSHKNINDMKLLGRLRARLFSGVYTEL